MVAPGGLGVQERGSELSKRRHRALQVAPEAKKKHGMLRWMLGCSQGVKIVAKIMSHDASKEKGPAAEGVALKIRAIIFLGY